MIIDSEDFIRKDEDTRTSLLKAELRNFVESEFGSSEKYFCLVYGSYAYAQANNNSDFDFMIVTSNISPGRTQRTIEFAKNIHRNLGIPMDDEIPYEHKLIISCEMMDLACDGHGFKNHVGQWHIPEIVKTKECLSSLWLRFRFLHALMTHCNHFIMGDREYYGHLRNRAILNLTKAVCAARNISKASPQELQDLFLRYGERSGDYYLGFREGEAPQKYLSQLCHSILDELERIGLATRKDAHFDISQYIQG